MERDATAESGDGERRRIRLRGFSWWRVVGLMVLVGGMGWLGWYFWPRAYDPERELAGWEPECGEVEAEWVQLPENGGQFETFWAVSDNDLIRANGSGSRGVRSPTLGKVELSLAKADGSLMQSQLPFAGLVCDLIVHGETCYMLTVTGVQPLEVGIVEMDRHTLAIERVQPLLLPPRIVAENPVGLSEAESCVLDERTLGYFLVFQGAWVGNRSFPYARICTYDTVEHQMVTAVETRPVLHCADLTALDATRVGMLPAQGAGHHALIIDTQSGLHTDARGSEYWAGHAIVANHWDHVRAEGGLLSWGSVLSVPPVGAFALGPGETWGWKGDLVKFRNSLWFRVLDRGGDFNVLHEGELPVLAGVGPVPRVDGLSHLNDANLLAAGRGGADLHFIGYANPVVDLFTLSAGRALVVQLVPRTPAKLNDGGGLVRYGTVTRPWTKVTWHGWLPLPPVDRAYQSFTVGRTRVFSMPEGLRLVVDRSEWRPDSLGRHMAGRDVAIAASIGLPDEIDVLFHNRELIRAEP